MFYVLWLLWNEPKIPLWRIYNLQRGNLKETAAVSCLPRIHITLLQLKISYLKTLFRPALLKLHLILDLSSRFVFCFVKMGDRPISSAKIERDFSSLKVNINSIQFFSFSTFSSSLNKMSEQDEARVLFQILFSSLTSLLHFLFFAEPKWVNKIKGKVEWAKDSSLKVKGNILWASILCTSMCFSRYFSALSICFYFFFFTEPKWVNNMKGNVEWAKDSSLKEIGNILWASILCTSRCSSLSSFSINLISARQKGHSTLFTFLESFISSLSFEVTENNFKHYSLKLITWHGKISIS